MKEENVQFIDLNNNVVFRRYNAPIKPHNRFPAWEMLCVGAIVFVACSLAISQI